VPAAVTVVARERDAIDLSKIALTHHALKKQGKVVLPLGLGANYKLEPLTEAGTGFVRAPERAYMRELIEKVNALFEGELTDQDKLVYVNKVLLGKLLESETLVQQAVNNSKEQFANSPDLTSEILNAIMSALDAHTLMSTQALNSAAVRAALTDILLNYAGLWEALRARGRA
jgi:type I restriction enzyme R subunit